MMTIRIACPFTILLMVLLSGFARSQAPKLSFQHITGEQGLSNSTIETIFQDSRGFMWFGTRDGLNRYDGYEMKVYRYSAQDATSISDNYIRAIAEDKEGMLWIGTANGLNQYDWKTGRFTRYQHQPGNKSSLSHNLVTSIYLDASGRLWVGTYGGLNLFQPKVASFLSFQSSEADRQKDDHINCLLQDRRGIFWIGTEAGLSRFSPQDQQFFIDTFTKLTRTVQTITEDKKGNLWIGTEEDGLVRFNPATKTMERYQHQEKEAASIGSNLIRCILPDAKGRIWIGGVNAGLNLFDTTGNSFYHYHDEPENAASLSQRTISALYEDNQGNLWVGTHRGGINKYTPNRQKFGLYRRELNSNSLSYNDVKTFCEDRQGDIWIGTDGGGLNRFNPQKNTFEHYGNNPYDAHSLGSNEVLHVMEDSQNNLWISTWGGGLNLLNRSTGSFTHFTQGGSHSISSNYVQKVFEDSRHNLWVLTYYGGLNRFDRQTKTFTRVESDANHLTHLMGNNFIAACEDRQGNLWFGTDDGGLNCYDYVSGQFLHYFIKEEKMPDLRVLFMDSKGRLWVGQSGLYLFDEQHKTFGLYTDKAGLATEFIKGMAEDSPGNFWISTSNGLTQFNPQTFTYKKNNTADGLQGLEFEANAYLKTTDGKLYFGGVNGFNAFYPKDIVPNAFVPPVFLTDFQISNQPVRPGENGSPLQQDILATKEILLSYKQATFSFGFAALNYTTSENNQYAYRLLGLDTGWNYVGADRKTSYTNLAPGTYFFEVKASNNDGVWNQQGRSVKVVIAPPFWGTWWFRTGIGLLVVGTVFWVLYFKRKFEIQKLEEDKREEIHQMQLQFFTNISHEFRTPLSLILGPLEKLQKEDSFLGHKQYYNTMHRNASRLVSLINELMDFRKVESGALKLKVMQSNLDLFLYELSEGFTGMAEEKNICFQTIIPEGLPPAWFDRQVLEKILINLIGNALKYTSAGGSITIRAFTALNQWKPAYENELMIKNDYRGKECIFIQVADNGIGISKESIAHLFERYYKISEAHLGSGVGLAFVKSLTLLHKGDIYVSSQRHQGTEIVIALPISKVDYTPEEQWLAGSKKNTVHMESIGYKYEQPAVISEENLQPNEDKKQATRHILIVDDNAELRQFLKESLEPQYHIMEAADGVAGLAAAKETFPDLIISDVMMPNMSGTELCKRIKEDSETGHIPFIMLTAKESQPAKLEGVASGADVYFAKPLSMDLLSLTIRNLFSQRQKLKDRYTRHHLVEAKEAVHTAKDKAFLDGLLAIIDEQLANPELDIEYICKQTGTSRTRLYQQIKSITDQSIGEFVRTVRLRKALQIMTEEDVPLADVMYRVGIQTQSYFTKAFKKEFGKTPTQFLQELKR